MEIDIGAWGDLWLLLVLATIAPDFVIVTCIKYSPVTYQTNFMCSFNSLSISSLAFLL